MLTEVFRSFEQYIATASDGALSELSKFREKVKIIFEVSGQRFSQLYRVQSSYLSQVSWLLFYWQALIKNHFNENEIGFGIEISISSS